MHNRCEAMQKIRIIYTKANLRKSVKVYSPAPSHHRKLNFCNVHVKIKSRYCDGFIDHGYDDLETVKQMGELDLAMVGVHQAEHVLLIPCVLK